MTAHQEAGTATPRTDALAATQLAELGRPMREADHKIQLWELARTLERDLTAAREALEAKERDNASIEAETDRKWGELWRKDSSLEVWFPFTALELERLRAQVKEQRERAATAEAALAGVREWIPVGERLPEDGVEVLANWPLSDTVRILVCERGKWFIPDWVEDELALTAPTHWRPLPAPPSSGSPAEGA